MSSKPGNKTTHILVFPYPAQGHMLPLLDLTHQLALRGLTITILVTPNSLPTLAPLLAAHPTAAVQTLVLHFPPHPAIPAGVENVRDLGNRGNIPVINALRGLEDPIARWFRSHPDPPSAIVADQFICWVASLAARLGVAAVSFSCTSAFLAALFGDGWLRLRGPDPPPPREVVVFPGLPGSPGFEYQHLPSLLRLCRESNPETDFVTESVLAGVRFADVIGVFNTFEALEENYLAHLRGSGGRVYAVGPLSLLGLAAENPIHHSAPEVAAWLDGCDEGSVLYVCFGSQKLLSSRQMSALALGLELSGVRFLWAVSRGNAGQVPDGFEERVGGRGMVVRGWAPQAEILGHQAVGGFLSHCGWNSALEAAAAGVTILAWPMEADQHVNARLLAEDLGVAARACEGADTVPDPERLARVVARAMARDAPEKARAVEVRGRALAAVGEGGSSRSELDEFVRLLRDLPKPVVSKLESVCE